MKINNKLINNIFQALSKLQSISSHDPLDMYTLFNVNEDGLYLTRKGRDFVTKIEVSNSNFSYKTPFKTLLDTKRMSHFLKNTPSRLKDIEIVKNDDNKLSIKLNKGEYKVINSNSVDEFEVKVENTTEKNLIATIKRNEFIDSIEDVIKVTKESPDTIKNLISFNFNNGELNLITTDGFRIANTKVSCEVKEDDSFCIKGRLVRQMIDSIEVLKSEENNNLNIYRSKNMIVFELGSLTYILNSSDEKYTDFSKAFVKSFDSKINVNAPILTEKLKRINSFVANKVKKITLEYGPECKLISHAENEGHSGVDVLDVNNFEGTKGKISFAADLLWWCLERYKGDIDIKILKKGRLIISSNDKKLIFVVLTFTS